MSAWQVIAYGSGTMTVQNPDFAAYFGIAYRTPFGETSDRERFGLAHDIARAMNQGVPCPDAVRLGLWRGSRAGIVFESRGPVIDQDPPNLNWIQDISRKGYEARVKLFDLLFQEVKAEKGKSNA